MSDAEVVSRVRSGETDAFRLLVERYQARALGLARRVLRDDDAAKDAVQEAFLKAYRSLAKFEGRAKFYTWFYRLVLNQCLDMKRRAKPERFAEFEDADPLEVAAGQVPQPEVAGVAYEPAAEAMRGELRQHIAKAIAQLPDGPRKTLVMREVDGLSYAEIAKALDVPKGTVMSRLHYARKQVKTMLIAAGVSLDGESQGDDG
ncbi:MAG: sigma-70 family RNA polymerase sigma factor [Myxococcales bacterium]|nr:sigma-70 family RNA polymerase sigma factor [Myxococcales bacterium]